MDIPSPYPIAALIMQTGSLAYSKHVLQFFTKAVQSDPVKVGPFLASALLPAILAAITCDDDRLLPQASRDAFDLPLVQSIFVIFSIVPEGQPKSDYVGLILSPLCTVLEKSPTLESKSAQFCGKGLTLLVRTSPEAVRASVIALPDG